MRNAPVHPLNGAQPTVVRRASAVLALLASLVVLVAVAAGSAVAAHPGANGRIAFHGQGSNAPQMIKTVNPDGSGLAEHLDANPLGPDQWDWYPAFESFALSFSPDGERLVFNATPGGSHPYGPLSCGDEILWSLDLADDSISALGTCPPPQNIPFNTSWSPDGSTIAFDNAQSASEQRVESRVSLLDVDSLAVTTLVAPQPVESECGAGTFEAVAGAAWSPLGDQIAFVRDAEPACPAIDGIWSVSPDGGDLRKIATGDYASPDWSPDGERILFVEAAGQAWASTGGSIWVVDADGGTPTLLRSGFNQHPVWSPDGTKIAFRATGGIYVMDADGANAAVVPNTADVRGWGLAWQPVADDPPPPSGRSETDRADDVTGAQIHVVYATASDGVDNQLDVDGTLAGSVSVFNAWLDSQTGGRSLRLDTYQGELDVTFFRLSRDEADIAAEGEGAFVRDALEAELDAAGFDDPNKLYAVYYDGLSTHSCGGGAWPPTLPGNVAAMYLLGEPPNAPPCSTNTFAAEGEVPGYLEYSMLHEIMHTLGFVSECAPNHHRAGHVTGPTNDLMYAGDDPWNLSNVVLDEGNDDYYSHQTPGCLDFEDSPFLTGTPPVADSDGDGVNDDIDTGDGTFSDTTVIPPTSGSILDAAGLTVTVADAPAPDGVTITVTGTGTESASFLICGFPLELAAGSEVTLTCGSVTVEVISGAAEIELLDGIAVVSIPAGATARISDTGDRTYLVENLGGGDVTVVTDGTPGTISPGGSSTVSHAVFTVRKDFTNGNTSAVTMSLQCSSGAVSATDALASEADPARFTVAGYTLGATCTASEVVPSGYTANAADCQAVAISDADCTIVNTPNATTYRLSVTKSGTGIGLVVSDPGGVNCGPTCSAFFPSGTVVTLTATPSGGSVFAGWSGACTGTGSCTVTMSQARSVGARFNPRPTYRLTVTKKGTEGGTVTSDPAGVNCGSTCSALYLGGTVVTLTASPSAGSVFTGWSGACTGTGACTVTMSQARNVSATFNPVRVYRLTVAKRGPGTGTISSSPAGIDCGPTCTASFTSGTLVTLTATASAGSVFASWSGACTGTASTCSVTMSQARSVTARFNRS